MAITIFTELDIMDVMDELDQNEKKFIKAQEELLSDDYPAVAALMADDELSILNDEEFDLLWFVIITLYLTIGKKHPIKSISIEQMQAFEESNWERLGEKESEPWRKRLDVFYEGYEQEDLLAFIEDSFESDEDLVINNASKEVLFVTAKSLLDSFLKGAA